MSQHNPNSQFPIPNSMQMVFLIGMPGAGKTWWGGKLAAEYQLLFIDLDTFIEQHEKASIPALFATYGELGYREREQKCLQKLVKENKESAIVACGGGTPCFYDNMQLMKEAGVVIYLKAETTTLIRNLNESNCERPLLKGKNNPANFLGKLLKARKAFYEQAHYILQADGISVSTFDEIISL